MADYTWAVGSAYDAYVGRWSRLVAHEFVRWLTVPPGARWLDVGCGTGALSMAVQTYAAPSLLVGMDPSPGFLATARARAVAGPAAFCAADARALPLPGAQFAVVVSGLALNFVPDPPRAAAELVRVATPGGVVAAYVWDYAGGMAMMRHFWEAAVALDPRAAVSAEGSRFTLCRPEPLHALWAGAGLAEVTVQGIEVPTVFADFDDYWEPFLGGQGAAPGYVASLSMQRRRELRESLRARLPRGPDGSIALSARAWAVRGLGPGPAGER